MSDAAIGKLPSKALEQAENSSGGFLFCVFLFSISFPTHLSGYATQAKR